MRGRDRRGPSASLQSPSARYPLTA